MPDKEIFVLKIVWKKSIASLHRLTQAVQRANLRRTAGDPTWVFCQNVGSDGSILTTFLSALFSEPQNSKRGLLAHPLHRCHWPVSALYIVSTYYILEGGASNLRLG